jgi:beta-galactosidase
MAAVRIRVLDENGTLAPFAQLPVKLKAHGALALVGPDTVTAEGGSTGCYVRTVGRAGKGSLSIETAQTEPVTVEFQITRA